MLQKEGVVIPLGDTRGVGDRLSCKDGVVSPLGVTGLPVPVFEMVQTEGVVSQLDDGNVVRLPAGDPVIAEPVGVIDTLEDPLIDPPAEAVINPLGLPVTVNVPNRVTVPVIVLSFELLYVRSGD